METESRADVNLEGDSAFMRILGLSFEEVGPERVTASFETGPDHHQPWGLLHGGVFTAVIETVATTGAYQAVRDRGQLAVGVNNVTDFMRPHQQGRLDVVAEPLQQTKTQQLWQVVISREDGKTVARGQVRLQNIAADG
ncbi:MAG: PaaI family thioesterase [Actinobacteria bacterium]|nr:PaaI family thioesterase [Actinomycetota bacterium]MCA1737277.1 PaaI family thioesterase [Actinomycetota bacterium]